MLLLGIDLGTSSVKVSVVESGHGRALTQAQYPDTENPVTALRPGWAEQSPEVWWEQVQQAILRCHREGNYDPSDIGAIGIAYQMHGLVLVDRRQRALRESILWCDSRAVETGAQAFRVIGRERCLSRMLNSPGNFTASKLAWVKLHEPEIYARTAAVLLPGDYIAMRLTGEITTTVPALSEGIFYDFMEEGLSEDILKYFDFDRGLFPRVRPVFGEHGSLREEVAGRLRLKAGIPVTYKAGDQPNNALSLNVLEPGEAAATAGTSGVIYAVSGKPVFDAESRVNTFAHVNYTPEQHRFGTMVCVNGTGSLYRWLRDLYGSALSYPELNALAQQAPPGCGGVRFIPFGNGAERILDNRCPGGQLSGLDFNRHSRAHISRAALEGIAFALRYGLDILRETGLELAVIRAGSANLFRSRLFAQLFVDVTQVPLELYENDGSTGAALGAGIGVKEYATPREAFKRMCTPEKIRPLKPYLEEDYLDWKNQLGLLLGKREPAMQGRNLN